MEDIKIATLGVSGQLGYELKDDKKPITKDDFITIMSEIADLKQVMIGYDQTKTKNSSKSNVFEEIKIKKNEGKDEP